MNFQKITFRFGQFIRRKYTYARINELAECEVGQMINIKGWIKGKRNMKEYQFYDISDGSCLRNLQVIVRKSCAPTVGYGSSVDIYGKLSTSPQGQYELKADDMNIIGKCPLNEGYPFVAKQTHPPEYIREHLHLRPRVNTMCSIFRVRHHAAAVFHNYLYKRNVIQIHTPILTTNICEGGGEVFSVKPDNERLLSEMAKENVPIEFGFFDKKTFLTVSGQLHLEAMCHGLGNCYTLNPAFRAENSRTPFHLAEFYMLEVELSFVKTTHDLIAFLEHMFKDTTETLLNICDEDINKLRPDKDFVKNLLGKTFPILTYSEAIDILKKNAVNLKTPINEHEGLSKEQELFLIQHTNSPLFVINWPAEMKPFYMRQNPNEPNVVEAFDFLVPAVGELAGGSVREDNYNSLSKRLPVGLEWYLNLRKYGGITTGGFGLGFERYLQLLLGVTNIKDVIPYPRWPHNCDM